MPTELFMSHPGPLSDLPGPTLPPGHTFRTATSEDAHELAELMTASYHQEYDAPWDGPRLKAELLDATDVLATWLIIAPDGQIVATASERVLPYIYTEGTGYVHFVGTRTTRQGLGLGRSITLRVLQGFVDRGLTKAVLNTADYRVPAVRLYLQLGFLPDYRDDLERSAWSRLFRDALMMPRLSSADGL